MRADVAALYSDAHSSDPGAVNRAQRLTKLKQEIWTKLPKRVRRYQVEWDNQRQSVIGLEAWGRAVVADIWSDLLAATTSAEAQTGLFWQQGERIALDDYVEDRARDFVGRDPVLARLNTLATSPVAPGSGSSTS
jgi:hypothetical protein